MVEKTRVITRQFGPVAWLVAANGRRAGEDSRLGRSTTIGRDGVRSELLVEGDSAASAAHARIRLERGRFVLYDLASTNGTFINKRRTEKQTLVDGDEIVIGRTVYVFKEVRK